MKKLKSKKFNRNRNAQIKMNNINPLTFNARLISLLSWKKLERSEDFSKIVATCKIS